MEEDDPAGLGWLELPVRLQDGRDDLPAHVGELRVLHTWHRFAIARGDGPIEQEDGDAPVDGIVECVDHHGLLAGLDDQARDSPADGGTDGAGQILGRRPLLRIGRGEPKGNPDLCKLDAKELIEQNPVGVRRSCQDQFDDPHTLAGMLPRGRDGGCRRAACYDRSWPRCPA